MRAACGGDRLKPERPTVIQRRLGAYFYIRKRIT
jgi:hypothetical protein